MARWLLTIGGAPDPATLRRVLAALSIDEDDALDPVPSNGDHVIEVEAPGDLPARARAVPEVRAVHPSSEMTPY